MADPSLLPSWEAWEKDKKVRERASSKDDWNRPAASWNQAFARCYQVVDYLLGRPPLPMRLKVLLIPEGSTYRKDFTKSTDGIVSLTFAFYYPESANKELAGARFSALVDAVARSIYEYQHVMDDAGLIKLIGKNETDQTINDEARSHCWYDSSFLALTSGTHTSIKWNPPTPEALMEASSTHNLSGASGKEQEGGKGNPLTQHQFSDAELWGRYQEAQSVSDYLRTRKIQGNSVMSNDAAGMNAVLSTCRAMTQRPRDLTGEAYPASKVDYVPFFPEKRNR